MELKSRPRIDNFRWRVALIRPFPASLRRIIYTAENSYFSKNTIDFLNMLPKNKTFQTESEFLYCVLKLEEKLHTESE